MTVVLSPTDANLDRAAAALRRGQRVGMPTETVYGLAANGLDPRAVAGIYAAKERPRFNPLILHVVARSLHDLVSQGLVDAERLGPAGRQAASALVDAAWPGPLTLVLPHGPAVPDLTRAGLDTVGLRAPAHPVAQALIARAGPLAAPSANRSGRISPTTAQDVLDELGDRVFAVLDGGPCTVGVESTVVHVGDDGTVTLLRPGAWSAQELTQVLGRPVQLASAPTADTPRSPGMTSRHYAPDTPFHALPDRLPDLPPATLDSLRTRVAGQPVALLCWHAADAARARTVDLGAPVDVVYVHAEGDLTATARGLYQTLRELDRRGAALLLAEPFPPAELGDQGLVHALRDRMARATTPLPAP